MNPVAQLAIIKQMSRNESYGPIAIIKQLKCMNPAVPLGIIKQMSRHESFGPAGDYQADEQA